ARAPARGATGCGFPAKRNSRGALRATVMEERLQKILSRAGLASRREAEKMIAQGRVRLNGQIVTEPGTRADAATDWIAVDGHKLKREPPERITVALH